MKIMQRLSRAKLSEIKVHYFGDIKVDNDQFYKTSIHFSLKVKGAPALVELPMKLKFRPHLLIAKINLTKFYVYTLMMFLVMTCLFYLVYTKIQGSLIIGGAIALIFYAMLYRSLKKSVKKFNFFVDLKEK